MIEWFLGDVVDELGTRKEVEYAYQILAEGTSADRQIATFKQTGDLRQVVGPAGPVRRRRGSAEQRGSREWPGSCR